MTSTSSGGASVITLQFDLDLEHRRRRAGGAGGDQRGGDVSCRRDLPNPPIYSKTNPADAPILTLALTSKTLPLSKVEDLADTRLAQKISQLSGVGLVSISGGQKPAVRIQANPTALSTAGLNLEDVRTAVAASNVKQAKGSFDGREQAYTIGANDQLLSSEEYRPLIIAYRNGAPVRLSDVARRDRRRRERQAGGLDEPRRRQSSSTSSGSRARTSSTSSIASRSCCRSSRARCRPAVQMSILTDRTDHDSRVGARRAVRADADHRAGRAGDLPVPAQRCRRRSFPASRCRCRSSARSGSCTCSATA